MPNTRRVTLGRRTLVRACLGAGAGLLIGLALPGCVERPQARRNARGELELGLWVRIRPDNRSVVLVPRVEMGQRIHAALARVVAEELDLDWSTVEIRQAPVDAARYGRQSTFGSSSVRGNWPVLREAAAQAAALLREAAAAALGVSPGAVSLRDSHAIAGGKRLTYAALAEHLRGGGRGFRSKPKPPSAYRRGARAGLPTARIDMLTGAARYASDLAVPGLAIACMLRPPAIGARLASFDPQAALALPGVIAVFAVEPIAPPVGSRGGIAVVAESTWQALQARDLVRAQWTAPASPEDSGLLAQDMARALAGPAAEQLCSIGDPEAAFAASSTVVEAEYELPLLAHVTMEPMNCTAQVEGGRCKVWAPTQAPDRLPGLVARHTGLPESAIEIEVVAFGGGFGRRVNSDFVLEAVDIARRAGRPVRVFWTREDDIGNDFYRPASRHRLRAALAANGQPLAWQHHFTSTAIAAYLDPQRPGGWGAQEGRGAVDLPYALPARRCEYTLARTAIPVGWWRGVDFTSNLFAVESFVDELATAAGADPIQYRLGLVGPWQQEWPRTTPGFPLDPLRLNVVLRRLVAQQGDTRVYGVACGYINDTCAALAVRVSGDAQRWRVEDMHCVVDCGLVVDPDGAHAQIEGGLMHGLSAALGERLTLQRGEVRERNLDRYPLLGIDRAPASVRIEFVESEAHPTGLGEIATPLVAPALANALARLTGSRPRRLPLGAIGATS